MKKKKQIDVNVDEMLKWINDNLADYKENFVAKVKEIENVFNHKM